MSTKTRIITKWKCFHELITTQVIHKNEMSCSEHIEGQMIITNVVEAFQRFIFDIFVFLDSMKSNIKRNFLTKAELPEKAMEIRVAPLVATKTMMRTSKVSELTYLARGSLVSLRTLAAVSTDANSIVKTRLQTFYFTCTDKRQTRQ